MNTGTIRLFLALLGAATLLGTSACRSYTESTPRRVLEGDNVDNYRHVFGVAPQAAGVEVVNSVVITYSWRPGVITSDDFEFELLASAEWAESQIKKWELRESTLFDIGKRKERPIRPWYAPKALEAYRAYRDLTSVGYVHLLVDRELEVDGRVRVFVSKH